MPDRAQKIEALLASPHEGERQAAVAALARLGKASGADKPARGTPAYIAAVRAYRAKIDFLSVNRTSPALSPQDVRQIRCLVQFGGTPWDRGAARVEELVKKVMSAQ